MWVDDDVPKLDKKIKIAAVILAEDDETMTLRVRTREGKIPIDNVHKIVRKTDGTAEVTVDEWIAKKERLA